MKLAVQQTITNISTFDMPHNAIINEIDWGGKNLSFSQKSDLGSNSKENQIIIHHLKLLHQAFRAQDMDNAIKESLSLLGLGSG